MGPGCSTRASGRARRRRCARELIAEDVFLGRERRLVDALGLHAQDHDDIRAFERVFDARA